MGRYRGDTYSIPLEAGGFCHNKNIDTIAPEDMVHPSRNIWLNEGGIRKRGGTTRVDASSMGATAVNGLFDYRLANGNHFILRGTANGKIWKTVSATIKTGLISNKPLSITQYKDLAVICNGANVPMTWNGVDGAVTNFADIPNDWAGTSYPKQIIIHGRGNSVRGWAVGCSSDPKNVYVSVNGDPTNFAQTTVLVFHIETGDGLGLTAGIEYGDRLMLFGKTKSFLMEDSSLDTNSWGYVDSQWLGGVAHHKLLVRTPNDLVAMMEDGEIYSVTTAQEYGDYKLASLTRPSFMHEWIKEHVNLSTIAKFHAVYDPIIRAIKFFVVRTGFGEINTCLCYFIDRPPNKAWVILDNQDYESGYSAVSSALVRQSTGIWKLYTGSYNGRVWKLGETNRADNGNPFQASYRTPAMSFDNVRETKRYDRVRIIAVREGTCNATLSWWIDGRLKGETDLVFVTGGALLGEFILGESPLGGVNILEKTVGLGFIGKRLQLELKNSVAHQNFFFSQMLVDFIPTGKGI